MRDRPIVEAAKTTVSVVVLAPVVLVCIVIVLALLAWLGAVGAIVVVVLLVGGCLVRYGERHPTTPRTPAAVARAAAKQQQDERIEAIIAQTDPLAAKRMAERRNAR